MEVEYIPLQLTRQDLIDERSNLRAEFQHAKRVSDDRAVLAAITKDILEIDALLREF